MTLIIGLSGGIASGKSSVAQDFADLGAIAIDADALVHQQYKDDSIRRAIEERFGSSVLKENDVDRAALARLIFKDTQARKDLEAILHPPVRDMIKKLIEKARLQNAPCVVLDVPLLDRSPLRDDCDRIVFVETSDEKRKARALERGMSAEDWQKRENNQVPLKDKKAQADFVICNDTHSERQQAVETLYKNWCYAS